MSNMWALIIAIIYLAILMSLVRPKSKGPAIVTSISHALTDLVKGIAGGTTATA